MERGGRDELKTFERDTPEDTSDARGSDTTLAMAQPIYAPFRSKTGGDGSETLAPVAGSIGPTLFLYDAYSLPRC